jgi:hypothetical protein
MIQHPITVIYLLLMLSATGYTGYTLGRASRELRAAREALGEAVTASLKENLKLVWEQGVIIAELQQTVKQQAKAITKLQQQAATSVKPNANV